MACKGNLNIGPHRDITGDRCGLGWVDTANRVFTLLVSEFFLN
jgi:hypothetical protein